VGLAWKEKGKKKKKETKKRFKQLLLYYWEQLSLQERLFGFFCGMLEWLKGSLWNKQSILLGKCRLRGEKGEFWVVEVLDFIPSDHCTKKPCLQRGAE